VARYQISKSLRHLIAMLKVYNAVFFHFHGNQIQPVDALTYSIQFTASDPIAGTEK